MRDKPIVDRREREERKKKLSRGKKKFERSGQFPGWRLTGKVNSPDRIFKSSISKDAKWLFV